MKTYFFLVAYNLVLELTEFNLELLHQSFRTVNFVSKLRAKVRVIILSTKLFRL